MKRLLIPSAALLSLLACAAPEPTESARLLAQIDKDFPKTNLRQYEAQKAAYLKALAAATNAFDKARAGLAYAHFEYARAMDDKPAKWRAAALDAYRTPGLEPSQKLALLIKPGVPGLDVEEEGWKVIEGHPELYCEYFNHLRHITRFGASGVEEKTSYEHRLAILEKALGTVPEERRMDYVGDYADALRHLGRIEEAEAALLPWGTNANPRVRAVAGDRLAAFYRETAKRYYGDPDAATLRKALAACEIVIEARSHFDPRPVAFRQAAEVAFALKDYAKAKHYVDELIACQEKRSPGKPDAEAAALLGDYWYYMGDYEAAVKAYSSVPALNVRPAAENSWNRYARALYATGRYEECLAIIPKLAKWCSLADRNKLYERILREKIAEGKGHGE